MVDWHVPHPTPTRPFQLQQLANPGFGEGRHGEGPSVAVAPLAREARGLNEHSTEPVSRPSCPLFWAIRSAGGQDVKPRLEQSLRLVGPARVLLPPFLGHHIRRQGNPAGVEALLVIVPPINPGHQFIVGPGASCLRTQCVVVSSSRPKDDLNPSTSTATRSKRAGWPWALERLSSASASLTAWGRSFSGCPACRPYHLAKPKMKCPSNRRRTRRRFSA